ncbi:MAG: DoxX family protein [Chitinophagaceae bacterium]|nr:DoxX family protein [Chitinophagaceae bacterium]
MPITFSWFKQHKDWGIFLLRLFIGLRLIYGVQDNVLHWEHMLRFRDFLKTFHFPFPLICAIASVYLQLIAGIMIVLGWRIRYASLLMIINFLVALIMVHRNDSIESMTAPLSILFSAVLFLFHGAGLISIDKK